MNSEIGKLILPTEASNCCAPALISIYRASDTGPFVALCVLIYKLGAWKKPHLPLFR